MTVHNFSDKLECSKSTLSESVEGTLMAMIPECKRVYQSEEKDDRNGVDYWAELESGRLIAVDHKTREAGCRTWWVANEPELALEIWSDVKAKAIGWTLDAAKQTEYIFYSFDQEDSSECFLIPFQLLRAVFKNNGRTWCKIYGQKPQKSINNYGKSWESMAVFVPASVVLHAVFRAMRTKNML